MEYLAATVDNVEVQQRRQVMEPIVSIRYKTRQTPGKISNYELCLDLTKFVRLRGESQKRDLNCRKDRRRETSELPRPIVMADPIIRSQAPFSIAPASPLVYANSPRR